MKVHVEALPIERIEELLEILRERAAWLEARGMPLWDPAYLVEGKFFERYPGARPYLAFEGDEKAGGFVLLERDEALWAAEAADPAFYIHKLAVRPAFAGRGYADGMLGWIAGRAAEKRKRFVRLDYFEDRPALAALYARQGFRPVDVVTRPDGQRIVRAELRVSREGGERG